MSEYINKTGLCSVTQVFSSYVSWDHIRPDVLANAAVRGSRVHDALADEMNGDFVIVDEEIKGYVDAGRAFLKMVDETILIEQRLISDLHQFTGQVDLVCLIKGDTRLTLVDWKTATVVQKSWGLQLAAYKHLVDANNFNLKIGRLMTVRLKKNGTYQIEEYSNPAYLFSVYLNVLSSYRFFNPKTENINWETL